jgi:outer membrane receptor protein involved in Fe transport
MCNRSKEATPSPAPRLRFNPLAIAVGLVVCSAAAAQETPTSSTPPDAAAPPVTLEERASTDEHGGVPAENSVVVTATRRRLPSREVPMQVNTVQAVQLQAAGARSLQDYVADLPGVDVKSSGGPGLGSITVRGVSTGNQTIATVGTYVDDVAVGSTNAYANGASSALDMSLLDLKQIELLRGPQGTLYGAGAMGGVLKYVTRDPNTNEWSAEAAVDVSSTKGGRLSHVENIVVNAPLREDVAGLRIAAFSDRNSGWVNAIGPAPAKRANDGHTRGGRLSLLLQPTAAWRIRLTDTFQDLKRDGTDLVEYDPATGAPVYGRSRRYLSRREPYALRLNIAAIDLEYEFPWARLNAITSYQSSSYDTTTDFTEAYKPLVESAGLEVDSLAFHNQVGIRKTTQEFRLTSKGGERIDWLLGLFWNREKATNDNRLDVLLPGQVAGPDLISGPLASTFREVAAYGDLTWNLGRGNSLTAGARLARNKQAFSESVINQLTGDVNSSENSAETSRTWLVTGKHALTSTSNVYARVASGYRPGGPNLRVLASDPASFSHDSLWSYEAGYKGDLLERTLGIEASLFKIRWSDIQQFFARNGLNVIINSGKATINGAELSAKWRATPGLTLSGSLALIDATLSEPAQGLGVSGSRLPNSARISGTLAARYEFELGGRNGYVGLTERHTGRRNAGFDGSNTLPNYALPAYSVLDLQAGADIDKTYRLAVYLRNATNRNGMVTADTGLVPVGGPMMVSEERPRTMGISLSANF